MSAPVRSQPPSWPRRSWLVAAVFAPILILTGIAGWVLPPSAALMSNATPYNAFHVAFGVVGCGIVATKHHRAAAWFNVGFGAIDLWQALAGATGVFPTTLFALRPADHVAHVVIGLALVIVGVLALRPGRA